VSGRESTKIALERYFDKQAKAAHRAMVRGGKRNQSPEKDVEKQVMAEASRLGFDLHVIESKAVYSHKAGRYLRGQAEPGYSDLSGNHGHIAVYIELKARGRRSTLSDVQRDFLLKKIKQGCFAGCVDSPEMFESLWETWLITPEIDQIELLLNTLPVKKS